MGLDSCVKIHLRKHAPSAFYYHSSLGNLYADRPYNAVIVDMNVELFRKPPHITTGGDWADYIFRTRVKSPPGDVVVLLFDSPPFVPATKDMTHLKRSSGVKRKRFAPLDSSTKFGDKMELPEWSRVTGTKSILPLLWSYLIDALRRIANSHPDFNKTFYVDTPMCVRHMPLSRFMDGKIHCLNRCQSVNVGMPTHKFGEGDLKTLAWVMYLKNEHGYKNILVWSTDLDNIGMFVKTDMVGVDLIGNTVCVDSANKVVPKKESVKKVYETIGLGQIARVLGSHCELFRTILVMGSTDFNTSVDNITTDRMIKTVFAMKSRNISLDHEQLLLCPKVYSRFKVLCYSKSMGNRSRPASKPFATSSRVNSYLCRCRWIKDYWNGKDQKFGGPQPYREGWSRPEEDMDLGTYKGKVRLVPV